MKKIKLNLSKKDEFLKSEEIAILLAEEKVVNLDDEFFIDEIEYLKLPDNYTDLYGIHKKLPCNIKLECVGGILTPSFELKYKLIDQITNNIAFPVEIKDCIAIYKDTEYRLSFEIYFLVNICKRINGIKDKEQRLEVLKELQLFVGFEDILKDEALLDLEIVIPSKISFSATGKDCKIQPMLLGGDELSIIDEMDYSIFLDSFEKYSVSKSAYRITKNKFVAIPEKIQPYLSVIKEVSKKEKASRKNFLMNPGALFSKSSIDEAEEEKIFVEVQEFVSSRISHIGIWEPKTNIFIPTGENEWIPKDSIGLKLGDDLIFINPESINTLKNQMENALCNQTDSILFEGNKIQINDDTILQIQEYSENNETISRIKKNESDSEVKREVLVSIIKDNLADDLYSEEIISRGNFDLKIPDELKTKTLYEHQKSGLSWLQQSFVSGKPGVLLADDMGLGKTLQCLGFLCWHKNILSDNKIDRKGPYFIVGPKSLLKNWKREIVRHVNDNFFNEIYEAHGSDFGKLRRGSISSVVNFLNNKDIVLTTYETLRDQEQYFRRIDWQVILFDECQKINNPNILMTEMAKAMASDFSIAITGTPIENRMSELWCIVDTVFPGYLKTYKEFRNKFEENSDNSEELKDILVNTNPPLMLRRLKSDKNLNLPDLPNKEIQKVEALMSSKQEAIYDEIIMVALKNQEKGMALKTIGQLKQISICPNVDDIADVEEFINASSKMKSTFTILSEIEKRNEKVIIFIESKRLQKKMIWALENKFGNMVSSPLLLNGTMSSSARDTVVEKFESLKSGFSVIIVSPKAGGAGITLINANNVIHLDRWWNPAVEDQASDRCFRIGQKKKVTIYHPLSIHSRLGEKSFDFILDKLLESKRNLSTNVIIPSAFSSEDFKKLFKETTDKEISDVTDFYKTPAWLSLRQKVFQTYGKVCLKCNIKAENGYTIEVDHIKPISLFPHLKLDFDNLQPLCSECNRAKSNTDFTDYRKKKY